MDKAFGYHVLARAGYGASPASLRELRAMGLPAWIEQQLSPHDGDDEADVRSARLRIRYPAADAAGRVTLDAMSAIDTRLSRDAHGRHLADAPENGVSYDAAYELGRPLKTLAQLIKMELGLQAVTVDLGGWDTHEYQPGRFKNQVERLSQGLSAFHNDMARYHDRLAVVVITEFGRRLRSNRSNGTDHGRGSLMLVMGGSVAGGKVRGRWPGLKSEQLEDGVDLAVVNDYRQTLAEVLGFWRAGPPLPAVFPGFKGAAPLNLFRGGAA